MKKRNLGPEEEREINKQTMENYNRFYFFLDYVT